MKRRNNEKTPSENRKNKSLKLLPYFAWRFFVFSRSFFISSGAFRYFIFLLGVFVSFRYFIFSLGVISSFPQAITPGKKTKKQNNEMAQISHHKPQLPRNPDNIHLSYDAQRRKRALMGRFSHFQFLTFFNKYMFKLLICVLFVRKLYTSVLKYGFV